MKPEQKEMSMTENKNWCAERDCDSNNVCGWCGYCEQHAVHSHPSGFTNINRIETIETKETMNMTTQRHNIEANPTVDPATADDAADAEGHQLECVCADCADATLSTDND